MVVTEPMSSGTVPLVRMSVAVNLRFSIFSYGAVYYHYDVRGGCKF